MSRQSKDVRRKRSKAKAVLLACQGDSSDTIISIHHSTLLPSGHEVPSQTQPPQSDEDTVQTQYPENNHHAANGQGFPNDRQLIGVKLLMEATPYRWMEGSQSQKRDGQGEPAVPDNDVESRLERE